MLDIRIKACLYCISVLFVGKTTNVLQKYKQALIFSLHTASVYHHNRCFDHEETNYFIPQLGDSKVHLVHLVYLLRLNTSAVQNESNLVRLGFGCFVNLPLPFHVHRQKDLSAVHYMIIPAKTPTPPCLITCTEDLLPGKKKKKVALSHDPHVVVVHFISCRAPFSVSHLRGLLPSECSLWLSPSNAMI